MRDRELKVMTQGARKIVIIGAGIAGLCAAVYARKMWLSGRGTRET
jgi:cation diffusion facilitator CzcD-associated flavoprotein CzcO